MEIFVSEREIVWKNSKKIEIEIEIPCLYKEEDEENGNGRKCPCPPRPDNLTSENRSQNLKRAETGGKWMFYSEFQYCDDIICDRQLLYFNFI